VFSRSSRKRLIGRWPFYSLLVLYTLNLYLSCFLCWLTGPWPADRTATAVLLSSPAWGPALLSVTCRLAISCRGSLSPARDVTNYGPVRGSTHTEGLVASGGQGAGPL